MKVPRIHRRKTGSADVISFDLSIEYHEKYAELLRKCKKDDLFDLELKKASKPRSTGYRSLNSHTHGHYEDIAEQLSTKTVHYSPEEIGRALKLMAMKDGFWPCQRDDDGVSIINAITHQMEPISEADSTESESSKLVEYIHWWADTNGLWLTEYVGKVPTRLYGGQWVRDGI